MSESERPVARCPADEVEAWGYPFYIKPATAFEPAFILLEDHVYNLEGAERDLIPLLVRIDSEADLERLGFTRGEDGVWVV